MKIKAYILVEDLALWLQSARWVIESTLCRSLYSNHDFFRQKNSLDIPNLMKLRIEIHVIKNIRKQIYKGLHTM